MRVCSLTPRSLILASLLYVTALPRKYSEEPGRSVMAAPIRPPVHDSAQHMVLCFRPRSNARSSASKGCTD